MTDDALDDVLKQGLTALADPPLPAALADRVGRLARAHLVPLATPPVPTLGFRLREALVPVLLMSAAVVRTADTMKVVGEVFGTAAPGGEAEEPPEDP